MGVIVSVYNTAVPKRSASQFPTTDTYWRAKELSKMGRELATVTRTEARQYIESMC